MKTEQEINEAIAIVQEAAREGRLEFKSEANIWRPCSSITIKYRAKPDLVERWLVLHPAYDEVAFKSEEEARNWAAEISRHVVHLREVE